MMRPDLANGMIVKVCRTLYRTALGVVSALLNPSTSRSESFSWEEDYEIDAGVPKDRRDNTQRYEMGFGDENSRLDAIIDDMGCRICRHAEREVIVKRHLAVDLQEMDARLVALDV